MSIVSDKRRMDQHKYTKETEVFHVPFRIPSNLSILKSFASNENDLSQISCEIILEEETKICNQNKNSGTQVTNILIKIPCL